MISCIFTAAFYAIGIFVDAITNITTIITNFQTNFRFMLRALYQASFLNFSNVIHCIKKFEKQRKIKWKKEKNWKQMKRKIENIWLMDMK